MRDETRNKSRNPGQGPCRFIVIGNEKGGSGKSTVAMHVAVALLRMNRRVASIDLDTRQGTLTRYIENRRRFGEGEELALKLPAHHVIATSDLDSAAARDAEDRVSFEAVADDLARRMDYVVIDTPGSASALSGAALARADILVTPLNDSFLDLDVLVRIDIHDLTNLSVSGFCETVLAEREARRQRSAPDIAWTVMRNRLTNIGARNKQDIHEILTLLSRRFDFGLVDGFSERVIYRELFLRGLTVLDLRESGAGVAIKMSHVRARQEVRGLMDAIGLAGDVAASEQAVGLPTR